jgi:hypothetical protein
MSESLSRLLQPPSCQSDNLKRKVHDCCHPGMRTQLCPTYHLPSPSKSNPVLVVVSKSRPPMLLLRKAQVSVWPPAANCHTRFIKNINRAIIYAPGSSHAYIQQNHQDITTHITNNININRKWIILLQPNQESVQELRKRKIKYMKGRAPQGRRLGDKRLEVIEAADVVLHVAGHWAAVEGIQENRRVERQVWVQTSTQQV